MVYGTPLTVLGEFLGPSQPDPDSSAFLRQLREKVGALSPTPTSSHSAKQQTAITQNLQASDYVFIRRGGNQPPLTPKYDGPFKVLQKADKYFKLQLGEREDNVSIDRLKPAYLDTTRPVQVALPPRRGRPNKNANSMLASTSLHADVDDLTEHEVHSSISTAGGSTVGVAL